LVKIADQRTYATMNLQEDRRHNGKLTSDLVQELSCLTCKDADADEKRRMFAVAACILTNELVALWFPWWRFPRCCIKLIVQQAESFFT
jgi:hypothetical protein